MPFRFPEIRPRQPLVGLAIAAVAGVAAADFWELGLSGVVAGVVILAIPLFTRWRSTALCWAFVAASFFALHTVQHHGSRARELSRELANGRTVVTARGIVWSVPEKPATWSRNSTCRFVLKLESLAQHGSVRIIPALLNVRWAGPIPAYGDRVSLLGSARNLAPPTNPGQFDYAAYENRQGIYVEVQANFATDCRIESSGHGAWEQVLAQRATAAIRRMLEYDLDDAPDISSLIESMVLGVHGNSMEETKLLFQRTGTMHLFAVSGLNVAMLGIVALLLLKPIGVSRRAAFFILLPTLALYALLTGWSASCVRACIMGGLVLGSYLADRPPLPLNSLAAAVLLILGWDTEQLFSPGFQFSFVLVLVLLAGAARLHTRILPYGLPDPFLPRALWSAPQRVRSFVWHWCAGNLSVSVAAWLGSLLLTAGYFHLFSLSTVLANLVAVPISFLMLALGIGSVLTGGWAKPVAILFNNANWGLAKLLLFTVKFFAAIPGGHTYVELPSLKARPPVEITVLDVGTGGAAWLRTRDATWLLDCASAYDYGRVVLPYLRSRGVNRLDGLLLTHGDAQHIGGAVAAIADFSPRVVVDSPLKDRSSTHRKALAELASSGVARRLCLRGDVLRLGRKASLRVLFPPAGLDRPAADDKAFVVLLESDGHRVLFMSDAGFPTEQWLLANEPELHAEMLIKGQHGKDLSATEDFLAAVQPEAIVASRRELGAPAEAASDWASMVAARHIALFAQEEAGAVSVEIRPEGISATGFANHQIFRSRAR